MADRGRAGRSGPDDSVTQRGREDSVTQSGREDSAAPGPGGGAGAGGPRPDQPGAAAGGGGDPVRGDDDPGFFDITDADIPVLHTEPSDDQMIATADSARTGDSAQSGGDEAGIVIDGPQTVHGPGGNPPDDGMIATADSATAAEAHPTGGGPTSSDDDPGFFDITDGHVPLQSVDADDEEPSTFPAGGPGRAGGDIGADIAPDIDDDLDADDLPDDV